jgi:hypothetical protein
MARFTITLITKKGTREDSLKKFLESNREIDSFSLQKEKESPSRQDRLSEAEKLISNGTSIVRELADEMSNWYESMPENLQGSDKGSQVEECASQLDEMANDLENLDFSSIDFPGMY